MIWKSLSVTYINILIIRCVASMRKRMIYSFLRGRELPCFGQIDHNQGTSNKTPILSLAHQVRIYVNDSHFPLVTSYSGTLIPITCICQKMPTGKSYNKAYGTYQLYKSRYRSLHWIICVRMLQNTNLINKHLRIMAMVTALMMAMGIGMGMAMAMAMSMAMAMAMAMILGMVMAEQHPSAKFTVILKPCALFNAVRLHDISQ